MTLPDKYVYIELVNRKGEPVGVTLVDRKHEHWIRKKNWGVTGGYARWGSGKNTTMVYLHRSIVGCPKGNYVDHINGNKLDNREENLRVCTQSENLRNRGKQKNNTSGFKGVSWHKASMKWHAQIWVNRKKIHIGLTDSVEEAARLYDRAALHYHGEFATLNFPRSDYV